MIRFVESPERTRIEDELSALLPRDPDPLTWALRPRMYHWLHPGARRRRDPRLTSLLRSRARTLSAGIGLTVQDRIAFVIDTQNQRRALEPVLALGGQHSTSYVGVLDRARASVSVSAVRRATALTRELVDVCRAIGYEVDADVVAEDVAKVQRAFDRALGLLDGIDALVVANQHSPHIRAMIRAARDAGVPTVYLPHAPVAATRDYADLPVDHAGVRGELEALTYVSFGAVRRPRIVGNTMLPEHAPAPDPCSDDPVVFAPSPVEPSRLEALVAMLDRAWAGRVVVAPHPRSDVDELRRVVPKQWVLHEIGSTFDRLRQGARAVVQSGSGVGWEALYLGIPVVDVRLDGGRPVYPYLDDPAIVPAHDEEELAAALERCATLARPALRATALAWCSTLGEHAAIASRRLIEAAVSEGVLGPVLDGWFQGGGVP